MQKTEIGKAKYVMLLTYNFTTDYSAVPCETEEEAIKVMHKWIDAEIETVKTECGYEPVVKEYSDDEMVIAYTDDELYFDLYTDAATYKVIEIGHGCLG